MTAVIAIESGKLDDKVIVSDEVLKAYGSNIYINVGEELYLKDLVYGLMLRSGNDASLAISTSVCDTTEEFVKLMNKKANELNMTNTYFCNPNGLDEVCENISTARDMALLTKYANKIPFYKQVVGTKRYTVKSNLKTYDWYNKNKLLSTYKYTTGGKTGFTEKARRTLVTTASKDDLNLIVVTLNDPNDFTTHKNLYEYGFNNYKKYLILDKDNFKVENKYYSDIYINNSFYYTLSNNELDKISIKYVFDKIDNPNNNDIVGKCVIYLNNTIIKEENIYVKVNEKKEEKKESIFKRILNWFK